MALPATIKAGKDPGLEEEHRGVCGAATSPNARSPGSSLQRDRSDLHGYSAALEVLDVSQRTSIGNGSDYLQRRESTPFGSETSDCS